MTDSSVAHRAVIEAQVAERRKHAFINATLRRRSRCLCGWLYNGVRVGPHPFDAWNLHVEEAVLAAALDATIEEACGACEGRRFFGWSCDKCSGSGRVTRLALPEVLVVERQL